MEFSEQVKATTQDALLPKVVDNVLGSQVLPYRIIGRAKKGKGESIKRALKYVNSGLFTSFAGLDTFTASQLQTKIRISYDMRAVRQPIALSGMDLSANAVGDTQVIDLMIESLEETQSEMIDGIGTMIYGLGTGNSSKDFLGIGAIVDDATDVTTLGGLSRSTYPVLNATRTASGGLLSLAALSTLFSAISSGTDKSMPTILTSNETVWDFYESLLTPTVREQYQMMGYYEMGLKGGTMRPKEGLIGTQGFTAVTFKGIGWVRDEKATAQNVFMLNENWLDFYGWDAAAITGYKPVSLGNTQIEGNYSDPGLSEYSGFNFSGLHAPNNQFGVVGDLIQMGNLMSWRPNRNGRLTGVTGV